MFKPKVDQNRDRWRLWVMVIGPSGGGLAMITNILELS